MRDKSALSVRDRGKWYVEVGLDCIVTTRGNEDNMFLQLRP